MRFIHALSLAIPVGLGFMVCNNLAAQTTVIVQSPPTTVVPMSPNKPPPPMSELVPPPPASATPTIWQPGHWQYTGLAGNPWSWVGGKYVTVPAGRTAWVPGQWQQQGMGWVWREGHWA